MDGKTTKKEPAVTKAKEKNGIDSMTYIDDLLLRIDKAESDIDGALSVIDSLNLRVNKVESRLGL